MQTIADHLHISKNAVSLALMNKKGVSEELKQKVLDTAIQLGYGKYAAVNPGEPHATILIVLPEQIMSHEDNEHFLFYHDLIWGLEKKVRDRGYHAILVRVDSSMEEGLVIPRIMGELSYLGMIVFGIMSKVYIGKVYEQGKPIVLFDCYHRDIPCPSVTSANIEGAYDAVNYLIAQGHRRIGFIGPVNLTTSHEERWFGYWKAMQEHRLAIDPSFCFLEAPDFSNTKEEVIRYWEGMTVIPDAIFCGNDRIALYLMNVIQASGYRVPKDISIMGFDDLKQAGAAIPPLTTMRVNKEEMCTAAVELITNPRFAQSQVRWSIPTQLVERDSVGMSGE